VELTVKGPFDKRKYTFEMMVGYFFTIAIMILVTFLIAMFFRTRLNVFKVSYVAYYEYGNDIKPGTQVTLNGIDVGEVKSVTIDDENRVKVELTVAKKYREKIREDSIAKIVRPLVIGNKQISISAGTSGTEVIRPGAVINSEESSELVDLISGQSLQNMIDRIGLNPESFDLSGDVQKITVREIYDNAISSLVTMNEFQKSMKSMSYEMAELAGAMDDMGTGFDTMTVVMGDMAAMDTAMLDMNSGMVSMADSVKEMNSSMDRMSESMETFSELTPLTDRMITFLTELEIIMEAMQNSWMLKKEVEKVKKKREREKK
jgi:phospholipid/cholesterol/gamma-HCH transport system substrate-binding protein